jgi:hypothetical protein
VHGVSNVRDALDIDLDHTTFSTLSGPGVSVTESIGPCGMVLVLDALVNLLLVILSILSNLCHALEMAARFSKYSVDCLGIVLCDAVPASRSLQIDEEDRL